MLTFENILHEMVKRHRKNMPQIKHFEGFTKDLSENGVKTIKKSVDPLSIEPTQHDFNKDKVKAILDKKSYNSKPIIVTQDGYILDGHHRWKACCATDDNQDVIEVGMDFDDLYDFVQDKDYIEYKELHEAYYSSNASMGDFASNLKGGVDSKKLFSDDGQTLKTPKDGERESNKYKTFDNLVKNMAKLSEDGEGGGSVAGTSANGASVDSANPQTAPEASGTQWKKDDIKPQPNSVTGIAGKDIPLFVNPQRRKELE